VGHIRVALFPLALERLETVGLLKTVVNGLDGGIPDHVLLGFPETIGNFDTGERNRVHNVTAFRLISVFIIAEKRGKSRLTSI
jgi:hypothetical protein